MDYLSKLLYEGQFRFCYALFKINNNSTKYSTIYKSIFYKNLILQKSKKRNNR